MQPEHAMADDVFPPTWAAAQARLAAVRPDAYARSRNHLDGAVTRLSPYITHGFLSLRQVLSHVLQRHDLPVGHKLVYELAWRAYFEHVWEHLGDGILHDIHPGPLPAQAYAVNLPSDIRQGCTGVPVIDEAVRTLYATGYLHNHARMWLASYVVHLRRVHWRAGADWMWSHLLDGDLASNHLSWQWVAGTGSHKPYLFNADNVARYTPASWHSPDSVIDTSYEQPDRLARGELPAVGFGGGTPARGAWTDPSPASLITEPMCMACPPDLGDAPPPTAQALAGRFVWLVHPWALQEPDPRWPTDLLRVALWVDDFHQAWPWSLSRWQFVQARMQALGAVPMRGTVGQWQAALPAARGVFVRPTGHLPSALTAGHEIDPDCRDAPLFVSPGRRCSSFSQYWRQVTRHVTRAREL